MTDSPSNHGVLDPHTSAPTLPTSPDIPVRIQKTRSTGNLLAPLTTATNAVDQRTRFSFDAGSSQELSTLKRATRPDYDHGLGISGLRRIRRPGPASRKSTIIFDEPELMTPIIQQSSIIPRSGPNSRSNSRSTSAQFLLSTPASPVLEDLHRFPAESLHSFSFSRKTEDFLHSRQNILQKSVDFMRENPAWVANSSLANAQARVSGDVEIQSMMDLLRRANVMPSLDIEAAKKQGFGVGPMTGPADVNGGNIFDKSFNDELETVESSPRSSFEERPEIRKGSLTMEDVRLGEQPSQGHVNTRKSGLKRTYTDLNSVSLQQKLIEALAQPYSSDEHGQGRNNPTLAPGDSNTSIVPTSSVSSVHGYGNKWTPPAQAVFRTSAEAPWTMLAANDLACLTFGVTRAEVRSLSILGIIQQERRQWLEEKLRQSSPIEQKPKSPVATSVLANGTSTLLGTKGGGITARLLSKASSRTTKTKNGKNDDSQESPSPTLAGKNHQPVKSRGVILCGDVMPISKRDGTLGAASFWVMEKRGGLIWVVEEITEDVAYLVFDAEHKLIESKGDYEPIWGKKLDHTDSLSSLIPEFPAQYLDDPTLMPTTIFNYYTASTMGGVNVPVGVAVGSLERELRISSLPHIAGAMVIEPANMQISSSNPVFSAALFGYEQSNGLPITTLIPDFMAILDVLTEEDDCELADGLVIPEHSFRRARALLALREGNEHAASIFLRPSGLLAKHKDGSEIMVDVQMRVVRSETIFPAPEDVIVEEKEDESAGPVVAVDELVYAVWITYSRQLHSAGLGVQRPEHLQASRPTTPPSQPPPPVLASPAAEPNRSLSSESVPASIEQITDDTAGLEPIEHPPMNTPYIPHPRKTINDFDILEEMGKGAYGEVKLARYRSSKAGKVVLKYVIKRRILVDTWTRDRRLGTVPLEIHVLDFLRSPGMQHPNIVEMTDFFEDDANYYIEMLPHGIPGMDLFDYIELRANMEETECRNIFRQVVDAVYHLHIKAKIVHRDIKDENVVLDGEGNVKLIDFGSATYIKNGPFEVFVGTLDYAAPEVLQGKPYGGKEQDVWALGILLYTLVYRENPFYNIDEILDHPLRVPFVPFSEQCIDLIRKMLDRDVDERITIQEVAKHDWLVKE